MFPTLLLSVGQVVDLSPLSESSALWAAGVLQRTAPVLHMQDAACWSHGLLRLCLVLQPAPDCDHCTSCAALAQTPLHILCRPTHPVSGGHATSCVAEAPSMRC